MANKKETIRIGIDERFKNNVRTVYVMAFERKKYDLTKHEYKEENGCVTVVK